MNYKPIDFSIDLSPKTLNFYKSQDVKDDYYKYKKVSNVFLEKTPLKNFFSYISQDKMEKGNFCENFLSSNEKSKFYSNIKNESMFKKKVDFVFKLSKIKFNFYKLKEKQKKLKNKKFDFEKYLNKKFKIKQLKIRKKKVNLKLNYKENERQIYKQILDVKIGFSLFNQLSRQEKQNFKGYTLKCNLYNLSKYSELIYELKRFITIIEFFEESCVIYILEDKIFLAFEKIKDKKFNTIHIKKIKNELNFMYIQELIKQLK